MAYKVILTLNESEKMCKSSYAILGAYASLINLKGCENVLIQLIDNPSVLHLVKAKYTDKLGEHPNETKFGYIAYDVRNTLVKQYGFSEDRFDSLKLEKSFKEYGNKAKVKSNAIGDFSDYFTLRKRIYSSVCNHIKTRSFANRITKEERIAVKTVINDVFDKYGVI